MSATTQGYLSEHTTVFTNVRSLGNFDVDGTLTVEALSLDSVSATTILGSSLDSGGRVFDIRAFGADPTGVSDSAGTIQSILSRAAGIGPVLIPRGTFSCSTSLRIPSNTVLVGDGWQSVLSFTYGSTGHYHLRNSNQSQTGSGNSNIQLRNFSVRGGGTGLRTAGSSKPGGIHLRGVVDFEISGVRIENADEISIAYQNCQRGRITNNYIRNSAADGITGYWQIADVVVGHNTIHGVGDDAIAIQCTSSDFTTNGARPRRVTIIGNTIFGQSQFTSPAAGRGIVANGVEDVAIVGNSISSVFGRGIYVDSADQPDAHSANSRSQHVTIVGNTVQGAGQAGDGSQTPYGVSVENTDYVTLQGNSISDASQGGLFINGCQFVSIVGNSLVSNGRNIANGYGIACSSSTNTAVSIVGNVLYKNAGAGILVQFGQGVVIANNQIIDNGSVGTGALDVAAGIYIVGTGGQAPTVEIQANNITDTRAAASKTQSYGIRAVSVSNATLLIANNRISGNSGAGVSITGTPNSLIQYANMDSDSGGSAPNHVAFWSPSAFTHGTALLPAMSFSSEVSLGWYRSGVSTMALSYGTLLLNSIIRLTDTSGVLPTVRFLAGTGNNAQLVLGRTASDIQLNAINATNNFVTGARAGDGALTVNSGTTLHLGVGTVRHQSMTSKGGRDYIEAAVGTLSLRTLATSAITASAANTNVLPNEWVFAIGGASGASLAIHSGGTVYIFNSALSAKAT